jgi:hypothetical protein
MARNAGYSNGSVCKFTDRVFAAVLRIRKETIKWPDKAERKRLSTTYSRAHMDSQEEF